MKKHAKDILLIAALTTVGGIIALVLFLSRTSGAFVEVRVDGQTVATYPLNMDSEHEIRSVNGGTNRLVIRNGEAWVESASCPDGLCVNTGHIRYVGSSVICLPNKVVVAIIGNSSGEGVDVVSGQ